MKKTLALIGVLFLMFHSLGQNNAPAHTSIEKLASTTDLLLYSGPAEVLLVTDERDGGLFYYANDATKPDFGVIYPAQKKGTWRRAYDKAEGVDISWFGLGKDTINDDEAVLKKALAYDYIKITRPIKISGKNVLPEGKTIAFSHDGAIVITDSFDLKFNAFIKANDYQQVFQGSRRVIFGNNATPAVSACWLGAKADCQGFTRGAGTDNTQALHLAIAAASKVSDLYLPPTAANYSYRITSTISISKKLSFFTFRFHGGGTTITYNADDRATNIFADFTDGPAINVQGSRRTYLTDFALHGINQKLGLIGNYDSITLKPSVNDPSNFLSPGVSLTYAGITTDAEKNSKIWSADVVFDRLQIDGFGIGIGISQGGHVQGDRMRVSNTQINKCVFGISVGQAQNRACHFVNVDMNRNWCGITNTAFGDHTGSVFQITGGQWCNIYKCFAIQPSYLGQCVVSGLYTEAVGCIGDIGSFGPNNSSILFTGCEFFMQDDGMHQGYSFTPDFYALIAYGNVTFQSCNFWAGRHYLAMFCGSNNSNYFGSSISLQGCSIHKCTSLHIFGNSQVENTFLIPESQRINYNRTVLANFDFATRYNTGFNSTQVISGMENGAGLTGKTTASRQLVRKIPRFFTVVGGLKSLTNVSLKGDSLRFDYDETIEKSLFRYVVPGDVLGTTLDENEYTRWDNPTLEIASIDHAARKITAWAHTRNFTFQNIALYTNSFFTTQPVTGIVKSGSDKVTNVVNCALLKVGDFITFKESSHAYRIKSVNLADTSLVLMDPVNETVNERVTLYNELLIDNSAEQRDRDNTLAIRTVKADETLNVDDCTILAEASGADVNITLPATLTTGHIFNIKKTTGKHAVIIKPLSGTIDGRASLTLKEEYQSCSVQFDGSNYFVLGR